METTLENTLNLSSDVIKYAKIAACVALGAAAIITAYLLTRPDTPKKDHSYNINIFRSQPGVYAQLSKEDVARYNHGMNNPHQPSKNTPSEEELWAGIAKLNQYQGN